MIAEMVKAISEGAKEGSKEVGREGLSGNTSVPDFAKNAKAESITSFETADKPLHSSINETKDLSELGDQYTQDLRDLSPYPETIEPVDLTSWEKVSSEEVAEQRMEFRNVKNSLIEEWEAQTGETWPTYDKDIFSNNGIKIRSAGDLYDAHHIRPLEFGGKNTFDNLTPLHAEVHYDRQGIHAPGSVFQQIGEALK
ncbi:HNH endonuclease signature motif containing protein [Paenibacillus sp. JDR-2]|uniref:HNH endonuclease signature motif containing protein n=1 Tax=Paenibacillus sp. (strain JDR-2) TaxID=324057 RepID=UPI000166A55A|nr:HNH endonuclease signature motif containing protein [Paenibacillus sp. JDR-2]ACT00499.1 HNH endonuclease [Paenibacillus sp. JDR-2]